MSQHSITSRNADEVRAAIAAGADVNGKDKWRHTPLHIVCGRDFVDSVRALIAAGADLNARDVDGLTPLHTARSAVVAKLLLAAGADVNAKDDKGRTPLEYHERVGLDEPAQGIREWLESQQRARRLDNRLDEDESGSESPTL